MLTFRLDQKYKNTQTVSSMRGSYFISIVSMASSTVGALGKKEGREVGRKGRRERGEERKGREKGREGGRKGEKSSQRNMASSKKGK